MKVEFYKTGSGRNPILEFIESLSTDAKQEFYEAIKRLSEGRRLEMPLSKSLASIHSGLHELRIRDNAGIYRVFYYIKVKHAIYVLHAFKKKTQNLPLKEIKLVLKRIGEI